MLPHTEGSATPVWTNLAAYMAFQAKHLCKSSASDLRIIRELDLLEHDLDAYTASILQGTRSIAPAAAERIGLAKGQTAAEAVKAGLVKLRDHLRGLELCNCIESGRRSAFEVAHGMEAAKTTFPVTTRKSPIPSADYAKLTVPAAAGEPQKARQPGEVA